MSRDKVQGRTPAVVLIDPKFPHNVGGALRACSCWGVRQLWWSGDRVTLDVPKGERLPLLGPEDGSLPKGILSACHRFVVIPTPQCLNLAATEEEMAARIERWSKRQP